MDKATFPKPILGISRVKVARQIRLFLLEVIVSRSDRLTDLALDVAGDRTKYVMPAWIGCREDRVSVATVTFSEPITLSTVKNADLR